jgi:hypothetical protein
LTVPLPMMPRSRLALGARSAVDADGSVDRCLAAGRLEGGADLRGCLSAVDCVEGDLRAAEPAPFAAPRAVRLRADDFVPDESLLADFPFPEVPPAVRLRWEDFDRGVLLAT